MVTGRELRILSMNRIYFCFVIRIRDSVPDPNGAFGMCVAGIGFVIRH